MKTLVIEGTEATFHMSTDSITIDQGGLVIKLQRLSLEKILDFANKSCRDTLLRAAVAGMVSEMVVWRERPGFPSVSLVRTIDNKSWYPSNIINMVKDIRKRYGLTLTEAKDLVMEALETIPVEL